MVRTSGSDAAPNVLRVPAVTAVTATCIDAAPVVNLAPAVVTPTFAVSDAAPNVVFAPAVVAWKLMVTLAPAPTWPFVAAENTIGSEVAPKVLRVPFVVTPRL